MPLLEKIAHIFCWITGKTIFRFFLHFEVKEEENLKGMKGPLIVAFNHGSWFDAFFINASLMPNSKIAPIHFATWQGHYFRFYYRPFLAMSGAFPIWKKIGLEESLKRGLEILKRGGVVGIAPEEKRRHFGRPRKGRRGVAFLALKTNSPVLPVYIEGNVGLRFSDFFLRKRKVKTKIGKPFYLPFKSTKGKPNLREFSNLVMEKIYQLRDVN